MTVAPAEKFATLKTAAGWVDTEPGKALDQLRPLLDDGDTDSTAQILAARALVNLERYLEAAGIARRAIERRGFSQELFSIWLHASGHGGDYAGQEAAIELGFSQPRMEYRNLLLMAQACRFLGMSERAAKILKLLIQSRPEESEIHARLGLVHQSTGDLQGAEACFSAAIGKDRAAAQNYYLLSCARKQNPEKNNLSLLREAWAEISASERADERQRGYIAYAMGKELEDLEEYENAFDWYSRAASAFRSRHPHSSEEEAKFYDSVKSYYLGTSDGAGGGYGEERPIFIVGMPRTGSTLIDTILSRHSGVFSAGEMNSFKEALKEQAGCHGGDALARIFRGGGRPLDYPLLGKRYASLIRTSLAGDRRITDKMPQNHVLLGIIARALPGARIICTDRSPADVCMSNFKQLFQPGSYSYSYSLEETARHCLVHADLTDFWCAHLPGNIHRVSYEDLVGDTESTVRGILEFCELDWESECLDFQSAPGSVNTASASQVREPIYRSSVERWRRYEKQLQPALKVLREGGMAVL